MDERPRPILARRLGKTHHISPLRFTLQKLARDYPAPGATCLEEWFVAVANQRGFRVIIRNVQDQAALRLPDETILPNEELVVGFCQLQCQDYPQILRLAAQIIARGAVALPRLYLLAKRERVEPILAELARLSLKAAPDHAVWRQILQHYQDEPLLREPLLHWTRLCEPAMRFGKVGVTEWVLVA